MKSKYACPTSENKSSTWKTKNKCVKLNGKAKLNTSVADVAYMTQQKDLHKHTTDIITIFEYFHDIFSI